MGRKTKVLAIDDDESFHTSLRRLSRYGLDCRPVFPPPGGDFADSLYPAAESTDVILIDYRLDDRSVDGGNPAFYRGGMVAAAVREKYPLLPVVLITTEEKHHEYVSGNPRIGHLFDHMLLKSRLSGSPAERASAAGEVVALADGFGRLRELNSTNTEIDDQVLADLLALETDELARLGDRLLVPIPREPIEIGRWLIQELLRFQGPLVGRFEAAAQLGVILESFDRPGVSAWLEGASYCGLFCGLGGKRWWDRRVAAQLINGEGLNVAAAESTKRAEVVAFHSRSLPEQVVASRCSYCQGELATRACSVCRLSTDTAHCLPINVDLRPRWALPDVICFRCIEVGRDRDLKVGGLDPQSRALAEEVRKSQRD